MEKTSSFVSHKFKPWDIVCNLNWWHQYLHSVNTGAVVDKVLNDWNLILKDCYGIHNSKNFVLKKDHKTKFRIWDTVKLIREPSYYNQWPSKFIVDNIKGTAVYYGKHRSEFYVENDLQLVARPGDHDEVSLPKLAITYTIIGILIWYLLGKYL